MENKTITMVDYVSNCSNCSGFSLSNPTNTDIKLNLYYIKGNVENRLLFDDLNDIEYDVNFQNKRHKGLPFVETPPTSRGSAINELYKESVLNCTLENVMKRGQQVQTQLSWCLSKMKTGTKSFQ